MLKLAHWLNKIVIFISFPSLILLQLPKLLGSGFELHAALVPISMAWIQFVLVAIAVSTLGRARKWDLKLIACLILTCGLGNTSFVGFPLIGALHGERGLQVALINDQLGSFLCLSTLGVIVACLAAGLSPNPLQIVLRILKFPPFLAMAAAFTLAQSGLLLPATLTPLLRVLSATLVPFALLAVVLQLRFDRVSLKLYRIPLAIGLTLKLLLIPLFFTALYSLILHGIDFTTLITILESAMAPMITGAILANEFDLEPRLASLIVSIGIPISLLTVPLWNLVLS